MLPSGLGVWVRYRLGVDSIWTGLGLPSEETGLEERLGLTNAATHSLSSRFDQQTTDHDTPTSKKKDKKEKDGAGTKRGSRGAKDLRRAYYRKSLQWHPDRWATMPQIYLPGRLDSFDACFLFVCFFLQLRFLNVLTISSSSFFLMRRLLFV